MGLLRIARVSKSDANVPRWPSRRGEGFTRTLISCSEFWEGRVNSGFVGDFDLNWGLEEPRLQGCVERGDMKIVAGVCGESSGVCDGLVVMSWWFGGSVGKTLDTNNRSIGLTPCLGDLNMVHDVMSTLLATGVSQQDVDAQKVISDDDGVFYFKFTSVMGMEQVMEKGKPIMFDAFTSSMCLDLWGRMGFARAMIEVSAENELKKEVTIVVPNVDGEGHTKQIMPLEFEWKPP
ncbi:hypothetical protein Tco_0683171 [Tanacetum coccineum]|uniref:Uncharacterized protein n=1 Tax=Tanacetum coccineum TaxID=301880 RepID=A0ABQ4XTU3_9ASTR